MTVGTQRQYTRHAETQMFLAQVLDLLAFDEPNAAVTLGEVVAVLCHPVEGKETRLAERRQVRHVFGEHDAQYDAALLSKQCYRS
jgi:hypothetical protein